MGRPSEAMKETNKKAWLVLAAASAGAIVALTLFPFDFTRQVSTGGEVVDQSLSWRAAELALNVLLFVPLAWTLGRRFPGKGWAILVLAAALSVSVEASQLFLPGRHTALSDIVTNVLGASAGLWLSRWQLPRAGSPIWSLLLAAWVIGNAHLARTGAPQLAGWESRYGVALGDEFGGGRTYLGQVHRGRLCVGREPEELCQEVQSVEQVDRAWAGIAQSSGAFRLEVEATPTDTAQHGPARLITWSEDASQRNATLAQDGKAAVLRVRSRWSTPNGTWPSVRLPGAFAGLRPGDRFRAAVVWRDGEARLWVTGEHWRYEDTFRRSPARIYRLRGLGEFLEPENAPVLDAAVGIVVALPGGLVAAGTVVAVFGSLTLLAVALTLVLTLPLLASSLPAAALSPFTIGATVGAVLGWVLGVLVLQRPSTSVDGLTRNRPSRNRGRSGLVNATSMQPAKWPGSCRGTFAPPTQRNSELDY